MGETIRLKTADGHELAAYRAGPADAARSLVVVQEIFGVNRHIRRVADTFAAAGYRAIAPTLFDRVEHGVELGYTQADIERGIALRARIAEAAVIRDIEAAAAAMAGKKGIVGFCWGGTVAWWGATRTTAFAAASCWYGAGIAATANATPSCPVQMHFGDQDASIPLKDVEAIRAAQPKAEIFVYPGAQHGFGCEERPSFSARDRDLAQSRTLAFFTRYLA